jgi:excinuclease UvrABC ATPase subunit
MSGYDRKAARAAARTTIAVEGARVHNLKNISLEIPRDRLIVVTGLSGSGKSSLAFDTIDVIKTADHVIDLGPEGGHAGGAVVVAGTPEDVARTKASHTGRFLKAHLHA